MSDVSSGNLRFAIRCLGLAVPGAPSPMGQFLETYQQHSGLSTWTNDLDKAMTFETRGAAVELYRSVHPGQPIRPWDNKPNRPLTAFTCEFASVEEFKRQLEREAGHASGRDDSA